MYEQSTTINSARLFICNDLFTYIIKYIVYEGSTFGHLYYICLDNKLWIPRSVFGLFNALRPSDAYMRQ